MISLLWLLSTALYYLGHIWSRVFLDFDMVWTYSVYNQLMLWSYRLSEHYDLRVWVDVPHSTWDVEYDIDPFKDSDNPAMNGELDVSSSNKDNA